jgi:hypothetical protein
MAKAEWRMSMTWYHPALALDAGDSQIAELKAENARLRSALTQFVAACETAPPTSLMIEIGMACKAARDALQQS